MRPPELARVCHEALRGMAVVLGDPEPPAVWEDAPEEHRLAMVEAVVLAQSGQGPSVLHDEWCMKMLEAGWHYGKVEDPVSLASPRMHHYSKLPRQERAKDALVYSIVQALSRV